MVCNPILLKNKVPSNETVAVDFYIRNTNLIPKYISVRLTRNRTLDEKP